MAKYECQYCGELVDEKMAFCPHCNAANKHHKRIVIGLPKDLKELSRWLMKQKLPPSSEVAFKINNDALFQNAYVIKEANGKYNVYSCDEKNKKVDIYSGTDAEYAISLFCQNVTREVAEYNMQKAELVEEKTMQIIKEQNSGNQLLINRLVPILKVILAGSTVVLFVRFIQALS